MQLFPVEWQLRLIRTQTLVDEILLVTVPSDKKSMEINPAEGIDIAYSFDILWKSSPFGSEACVGVCGHH